MASTAVQSALGVSAEDLLKAGGIRSTMALDFHLLRFYGLPDMRAKSYTVCKGSGESPGVLPEVKAPFWRALYLDDPNHAGPGM